MSRGESSCVRPALRGLRVGDVVRLAFDELGNPFLLSPDDIVRPSDLRARVERLDDTPHGQVVVLGMVP